MAKLKHFNGNDKWRRYPALQAGAQFCLAGKIQDWFSLGQDHDEAGRSGQGQTRGQGSVHGIPVQTEARCACHHAAVCGRCPLCDRGYADHACGPGAW